MGTSFELEVESFRKHYVESPNDCSRAELETVSHYFVDFVSYVVHSLLDKVQLCWLVKLSEYNVSWLEVSYLERLKEFHHKILVK